MDCIQIRGGTPLKGEVLIQGSKNAALPVMAACVLVPGITVLKNCPDISDVDCMCRILQRVGVKVKRQDDALLIDASKVDSWRLPEEYETRMRSSVILAGAMLGRCRKVCLHHPGGCVIGDRPIDMHIRALERLGVCFEQTQEGILGSAARLAGGRIDLPFPSVGATENVILAAVLAKGCTRITGCALEPEIAALCSFLNGAGARIKETGRGCLFIEGVERLRESCYRVESDRIVAGTYLMGALAAGGDVFLRNAQAEQLECVLQTARWMGAVIRTEKSGVRVTRSRRLTAPERIRTEVYPGFPTDLQSPMLVVLSQSQGECLLTETIFNGRLAVAEQLNRMGARIVVEGCNARTKGPRQLTGCCVHAGELRGGAALVLAGLCARGDTEVYHRCFIDRGYEDIVRDLRSLGADIGVKT